MDKPPKQQPTPRARTAPAAKQERLEREAAALRANLRKRKDQARARDQTPDPPKQD